MAREKGTFNFSANLEVKKQGALDSRLVVQTFAELFLPATWADSDNKVWLYDGMIVSVVADNTGKNGVYKLDNKDTYTSSSSWTRIDVGAASYVTDTQLNGEISRVENNFQHYQLNITETNKLSYSLISDVPTKLSQFNNDTNHVTAVDINEEVDDVELTYVIETLLESELEKKQDKLISGTNVRTINGNSILGNGDIVIRNDNADILNLVYPVGSIYLSVNEVNPSTLFGFGEWEMIKDTFLLGAGDTYQAGSIGGEATHTLTEAEMPNHSHSTYQIANFPSGNIDNRGGYGYTEVENSRTSYGSAVGYQGGDKPHNNMPPYLTVYIWKRIS